MQSSHFCVKRAITCNIVQFTLRMTRMNTEIDKGIIILQWSFCLLVDLLIFMKMSLFSSGKRVIFLRRIMTGDNFSTQRYDHRSLFCGGHYSSLHRNWWVQLLSQRCMGSISLDRRGGCVILIDFLSFTPYRQYSSHVTAVDVLYTFDNKQLFRRGSHPLQAR